MALDRRAFLFTGSAAAAAGVVKPLKPGPNLQDWNVVREQFDLAPNFAHLSMFFLASHPRSVRAAIDHHRQRLDKNPLLTVEEAMFGKSEDNLPIRICERIGKYIGAAGNDIALTSNTTSGLSILYQGLPLKAGDDLLLTTHDHYVHHEAARLAAERCGASWRKVALFDAPDTLSPEQCAERVKKAILPNTRAVGVTWVLSSNGVRLPVRAVADAIASVNAQRSPSAKVLLFVDGVHGLGVEDPRLLELGCDGFAAGTHKWIFGPRGTGFVWARPEVWSQLRPTIPTMHGLELFAAWRDEKAPGTPRAAWFSPGGFQAFEHHWALPQALDFHEAIGPARITERVHTLNLQMNEELRKMPHVVVHTPRSEGSFAGVVSFDVKGMKAGDVVQKLLEKKILASTSPYRESCVRVSFGIMNTTAEVVSTAKAVRALA